MKHEFVTSDGLHMAGYDEGQGRAVIFQHGLGGDQTQVAGVFPTSQFRRLTLECRAQGHSQAGDPAYFSIQQFADDVLAFADARGVDKFAIGGISMGAAIALRLAVIAPTRLTALILSRPAWDWHAAPSNMAVFLELIKFTSARDRAGFEATKVAQHFAKFAPDNYATLLNHFERPNTEVIAELLGRISKDGPRISEQDVRSIKVPTLVIGNDTDLIHPLELAHRLNDAIPHAQFVQVAAKAFHPELHAQECRSAIATFLNK